MSPPEDELDFELSPDEIGPERDLLVGEAAALLDQRRTQMSGGDGGAPSDEGDLARELSQDVAEMKRPEVLPLDTSRLETDAPVEIADLLERYRFYWMSLPIDLWAAKGRGFNELQVKVSFNPNLEDALRPRTHDILPDQQFRTMLEANTELGVGVGANLQFSAGLPPIALDAAGIPVRMEAEGDVSAGGKTGFVLGPLKYAIRTPVVKHSAPGFDVVRWRLEQARIVEEQDPGLRVILKIPRDAPPALEVRAVLRARRYFNAFDAGLQRALADLPARFGQFFGRGAPKADVRTWDLASAVEGSEGHQR